jgi:hypothetical protein
MKVLNQAEIGELITMVAQGDAFVAYAREDHDGFVYVTVKKRRPSFLDELPKQPRSPS